MTPIINRICFYSRKVNEYNRLRFDIIRGRTTKTVPATRALRLLAYKTAMYKGGSAI
jgi:hypothetical protein